MYNRYVPQSDGSFRKNRIPESGNPQPKQSKPSIAQSQPSAPPPPCPPPVKKPQSPPKPVRNRGNEHFLRQLLPQGMETGDLLIAVLLLLMAGDCEDDKNTALLTLALYLFL